MPFSRGRRAAATGDWVTSYKGLGRINLRERDVYFFDATLVSR